MRLIKKYLSDGEQLLRTAVVCFILFPLLAIITTESKLVHDLYWILLFTGTIHTILAFKLFAGKKEMKGVILGLILSGLGLFNGFLFLFSIINDENAGNVVIYELIIITIVLWVISLVRSLRY